MGIRDGLEEGAMTSDDCSVGTIVWVRRRNGSWWPGKIVGDEELANSHLMSPRSGTPVKLLGRDDASVDWYNLEKSRRVKAFRCGEFDDCIAKAASSQGKTPIKKREKYARREDAILHALELEREQLEKKPRLRSGVNNLTSKKLINVVGTPDDLANGRFKDTNLKSQTTSKKLNSFAEVNSMGNSFFGQPASKGNSLLPVYNHVKVEPGVRILGGQCLASCSEKLLGMKRTRAPVEPSEEFPVKKRDRRRCLAKVLRNSAKLETSSQATAEGFSISATGEKEPVGDLCRLKRIQSVTLPAKLNNCLQHTNHPGDKMLGLNSQFKTGRHVEPSSSTEENSSSELLEDKSDFEYVDQDVDEETPVLKGYGFLENDQIKNRGYGRKKPQLKFEAARNDRGRKRVNFLDSEGIWEADRLSEVASRRYWDESSVHPSYGGHSLNDRTKSLLVDVDIKVKSSYHGQHVPLVSLMSRLNGKAIIGHPVQIEALTEDSMGLLLANKDLREATIDGSGVMTPVSPAWITARRNKDLREVTIDGSCGMSPVSPAWITARRNKDLREATIDGIGGMAPASPAWITARRTVMLRVRRPNIFSSAPLDAAQPEASNLSLHQPSNLESKLSEYRKLYSTSQKSKFTRTGISEVHSLRKTLNDPLSKVTLSSQKTRMLSSIAAERKHSGTAMSDQKLLSKSGSALGGLIRLDEIGSTVVTCIPVKLVFSRLRESVGRPPSFRTERRSYMVSVNGGDHRKEKSIGT